MTYTALETQIGDAFARDTAEHQMTVLHEDGLYRHVRFRRPNGSFYWFDLITWPNNLTINGDMGCWTFSRVEDMFDFFAGSRINPSYWDEKVRGGTPVEEFSERLFKEAVLDHINDYAADHRGLKEAVEEEIFAELDGHEETARQLLDHFRFDGQARGIVDGLTFRFEDTWEWRLKEHSYHFLWCCFAIQWGVNLHRAAKVEAGVA